MVRQISSKLGCCDEHFTIVIPEKYDKNLKHGYTREIKRQFMGCVANMRSKNKHAIFVEPNEVIANIS